MYHHLHPHPNSNPFSTCNVRPGKISFYFPSCRTVAELLDSLHKQNWHGQIVGPHGSGKSTLLESLLPGLRAYGREIQKIVLHSGKNRRPFTRRNIASWQQHTQVIVDGYEQLLPWQRIFLRMICRWKRCGLLVTTHKPIDLPLLYTTRVTPLIARKVVEQLLPANDLLMWHDKLEQALYKNQGNLRDTFFELYDLYEAKHRDTIEI